MPNSVDSDSPNRDEPAWTLLDRDGLVDAYWDVIAPAMRADGLDPETEQPTYEWLNTHGFRRFIYTLQEHHDTTVTEFCKQELDLDPTGFDWEITDSDTVDALERYLDRQQQRKSWSESTVAAHRSRLARYVRAYATVNETADLLAPVDGTPTRQPTKPSTPVGQPSTPWMKRSVARRSGGSTSPSQTGTRRSSADVKRR